MPFGPLAALAASRRLLRRTGDLRRGKLGRFVSLYERHGLPIQLELLGRSLGYFTTETGELDRVAAL